MEELPTGCIPSGGILDEISQQCFPAGPSFPASTYLFWGGGGVTNAMVQVWEEAMYLVQACPSLGLQLSQRQKELWIPVETCDA